MNMTIRQSPKRYAEMMREAFGPERALEFAELAVKKTYRGRKKEYWQWTKIVSILTPPPPPPPVPPTPDEATAAMRSKLDASGIPYSIDENGHAVVNKWDFIAVHPPCVSTESQNS